MGSWAGSWNTTFCPPRNKYLARSSINASASRGIQIEMCSGVRILGICFLRRRDIRINVRIALLQFCAHTSCRIAQPCQLGASAPHLISPKRRNLGCRYPDLSGGGNVATLLDVSIRVGKIRPTWLGPEVRQCSSDSSPAGSFSSLQVLVCEPTLKVDRALLHA
jgi:hypothetical protein